MKRARQCAAGLGWQVEMREVRDMDVLLLTLIWIILLVTIISPYGVLAIMIALLAGQRP